MRIAVPKESRPAETRVALVPETVRKLIASSASDTAAPIEVAIESSAGAASFLSDDAYRDAGALITNDADALWREADLIVCVNAPAPEQVQQMREGAALLTVLKPNTNLDLTRALVEGGISAIAFDAIPRITRAQSMDALSSMSTIAGYCASLLAARRCPRFFPMLMTAAGTITPARVLIVGVGVAGLQAIATCRRLGATVEAYDIRPAAKEQALSLGARYVELPKDQGAQTQDAETAAGYAREQTEDEQRRQRDLLAKHVADADVVITTALVPGRPAPRIVTSDMVARMKPGALLIDLAAEAGGNCELSRPDEEVTNAGVTILGPTNLAADLPVHASQMYSRNAAAIMELLIQDGELSINLEDDVLAGAVVTHAGEVRHEPTRAALGMSTSQETTA